MPNPSSVSNFYLALLLLPKKKRQAMFIFYSFCRAVDDAVDLASSPSEAKRELGRWRYQIALCYDGSPTQTDAQQLQKVIRQYKIPRQEIEDILRGIEMDIAANRFQTFQELEEYCYCVASAVGLVSSRIFGVQEEHGRDFAVLLGKALQLTNILRDIKEDNLKGRIYIPQNELEQFDYLEDKLNRCVEDESFMKLLDFQCHRARLFFKKADDAFKSLSKDDQKKFLPARIMEAVYKAILEQIEKNPDLVLKKRLTVPLWKKMAIALKYTLTKCVLISLLSAAGLPA
ncbi:MAG: presqualene diphosphate synthase HpnD [Candidatus Omnitrophica bacterium]|nr:presqualene diphosphate synthase HpnD [Candidatus Omnitrophota bacterium]